jgi:hypothetical protein
MLTNAGSERSSFIAVGTIFVAVPDIAGPP